MTGKILPRYLIIAVALAAVVSILLLTNFYLQYRWMAGGLVETGMQQHELSLASSFERRSRARLRRIADSLEFEDGSVSLAAGEELISHVVEGQDDFAGLRFVGRDGTLIEAGTLPGSESLTGVTWDEQRLYLRYPITRNGEDLGTLFGNFDLAGLHDAAFEFRDSMVAAAEQHRRSSFLWIGSSMAGMLLLCGFVVWFIIRSQNQRIREIKIQAENLGDARFGAPLQGPKGDELGELVDVFNNMRERLQRTTISRDYVDNILSSMNEAIIVTSADNVITKVNHATTRMLEFAESELVGRHLREVIDSDRHSNGSNPAHQIR